MEVKHKDHKITYREADNSWFSEEVGAKPSLAAAKKAIDDLLRKGRRADITVLMIKEPYWRSDKPPYLLEVKLGTLAEPRRSSGEITEAWITYPGSDGKGTEREKVGIRSLYAPAERPKLEEYLRLKKIAIDAGKVADAFHEKLEGLDADKIKELKEGGG